MKGKMRLMLGYDENFNKRAVALKFDGDRIAPVVVASGLGHMADKIIEIGAKNEVPVYEDTSLATMLSRLECGTPIPEELYATVVDIYGATCCYTKGNVGFHIKVA